MRSSRMSVLTGWLVAAALIIPAPTRPGEPGQLPATTTVTIASEAGTAPLQIEYLQQGEGRPMVLMNGFALHVRHWERLIPLLAERYTVYAYHYPGMGDSSPLGARYDLDAYLEQLLLFTSALNLDPAILVGHGMGAQIALAFAAEHPERVDGLVLIDPCGGIETPAMRRMRQRIFEHAGGGFDDEAAVPFLRDMLESAFVNPARVDAGMMADYRAMWDNAASRSAFRQTLLTFSCPDAHRYYTIRSAAWRLRTGEPLSHQALLVWGSEDNWIPVSGIATYLRDLPGAAALVVDRAGHFPQEERPELVAAAIITTLDSERGRLFFRRMTADTLLAFLENGDVAARGYAARALGELGEARAAAPLTQLLDSEFETLRWEACRALTAIGSPAVPALVACLADGGTDRRFAAAELLGAIGDGQAVPGLLRELGDDDPFVSVAVLDALAAIGDPAVTALIEVLETDRERRGDAVEALVYVTGEDFGDQAHVWKRWWHERQGVMPTP